MLTNRAYKYVHLTVFVFSLFATGLLGLVHSGFVSLFLLTISSYSLASLLSSLLVARRRGWRYFPLLSMTFAVMHFGWGMGFLLGLARTVTSALYPVR